MASQVCGVGRLVVGRKRQDPNTLAFSEALQQDLRAIFKADRVAKSRCADLRKPDLLHRSA